MLVVPLTVVVLAQLAIVLRQHSSLSICADCSVAATTSLVASRSWAVSIEGVLEDCRQERGNLTRTLAPA